MVATPLKLIFQYFLLPPVAAPSKYVVTTRTMTMALNCLVRVLLRNYISHSYFCIVFRGGQWGVWLSMLSFLLSIGILTRCSMQLWWQCKLWWESTFSTIVCLVHLSPFFSPYDPFDNINLSIVHLLFHPYMYPSDAKTYSDIGLRPTYTIKSNLTEPSYSSVIQLTSESSSSAKSRVSYLRRGRGFIRTRAVPHGRGRARRGGHGDTFGRVRNGFVPY